MKAAIIDQFGGPEVFKIEEVEKPKIKPDQLLVKVKTVGINPIDWKQRNGNHRFVLGAPFPIVFGYDVCGEVVEIGNRCYKFKVGDEVFGVLDNKYGGALAEFAAGHEKCFAIKPKGISNEEAAAFPMVALTALQALRDKINLRNDQTIVFNGASGGVGHVAIQIAKLMGAKVIAVAGKSSKEFVSQFKPDEFIDYTEQHISNTNIKTDIFFDVIGNLTFPKIKHLLKPGGTYLNLNYIHSLTKLPVNIFHQLFSKGKKAKTLLMKHDSSDLDLVSKWIQEKKIKICLDKIFPLDKIHEAHRYAEQGHNKGKNVVVISE